MYKLSKDRPMNFLSKHLTISIIALFASIPILQAQNTKGLYIPQSLRDNDFNNPESQWSYDRMATTENFVVFWEKGFGKDLANAPKLDGQNMSVDLKNLLEKLETYYTFYRDELKFVLPNSKTERYKMMVMLNYSLEGTAYGGDYDREIGALWISPNRVQDKKLNCIAHELGHSFQSQISSDGQGEAWGGGGIFEMASQWMLWNVNPEWTTDENYHWQDFKKKFHLQFLHSSNIYHSPYVLEYWSMRRGKTIIGDLFRHGRRGEDPLCTYMRLHNINLENTADEMYDCYARLQTFDFPRIKDSHRKFAGEMSTAMQTNSDGSMTPQHNFAPGTFGFNVIDINIPNNKNIVTVTFEGIGNKAKDGFRYGLIAIDNNGNAQYSKTGSSFKGKVDMKINDNTNMLKMVVMGYPKDKYTHISRNDKNARIYNYKITIK